MRIFCKKSHGDVFPLLPDGSATYTQATGDGSLSSSEEILSIGMTGRHPPLRSNLFDVCGTCSGTRGAVSLFPTQLLLLLLAPAQTLILPQHLLLLLLLLEPAEQDPHLPPKPHAAHSACPLPKPNHGKRCMCPVTSAMCVSVANKSCLIRSLLVMSCLCVQAENAFRARLKI